MATKTIKYSSYRNLLNRVAYKLIESKKTYKHRKSFKVDGKEVSYEKIIKKINANGTKYTKSKFIANFIETLVVDNNDLSFLPDYVLGSSGKTKYSRKNYVDMIKNTISFRKEKSRNPKTVTVKYSKTVNSCQNPYTSKPHYHELGCNKLGQCTSYFCGPHSIHQGLRKFKITDISEAQLAKWAGTTTNGTDHDGLNTAIAMATKKAGIKINVEWHYMSDFGKTTKEQFATLAKMACKKNIWMFFHIGYQGSGSSSSGQIFGHYEGGDVIDVSKETFRAMNSLGNKCGSGYCGHLQTRSFGLQKHYINNKEGVKSVCIMTKV